MGLWCMLLFVVSQLPSCLTQDTSSEMTKFVQAGSDLFLEVKESAAVEEDSDFAWKLNGRHNVVKKTKSEVRIHSNYTDRALIRNYTLVLKDVQQKDSGEYRACVSGESDHIVAKYKVTVQNPVSPIELRVNSVSRMSDSCNFTVTCRSQESHVNSTVRCDTRTCSQEGGRQSEVPVSGASLRVYLLNASIVCNHSNQVSWTTKMADTLCTQINDTPQTYWKIKVIAPIIVLAVVMVIILVVIMQRRRKGKRENIKQPGISVSAVPQEAAAPQPRNQSQSDDNVTSTYCLVGPHTAPAGAADAGGNAAPESLYSRVEKPART